MKIKVKDLQLIIKYIQDSNIYDAVSKVHDDLVLKSTNEIDELNELISNIIIRTKHQNYNKEMIIGYLNKLISQTVIEKLNQLANETDIISVSANQNNPNNYNIQMIINDFKNVILNVSYETLMKMVKKSIDKLDNINLKNEKLFYFSQI